MRLLDHMREEGLDDDAFAERIGDCSGHAVKKWKYGEREPDAGTMFRIESATDGKVTLQDWARQAEDRRGKRPGVAEPESVSLRAPRRETPHEIPCVDPVGFTTKPAAEVA